MTFLVKGQVTTLRFEVRQKRVKHFKQSHLAPQNSNSMDGLKSAIFSIFQKLANWLDWPCPVCAALQNCPKDILVSFISMKPLSEVAPGLFDHVENETTYASSENKHFSLNLVIVRLTKIMKRADKNWAQF